jgi:ankyrin repeat protein
MSDLHSCVEKGDTTRVLELLKQGEHVILINQPNSQGVYPLHVAAKVGNVQIAEILIQNNAKVGCLDQYGLTPLHYAARSGNKDVLVYLLKQKTQVDCQEKGFWTPLHYATYYKHTDLVKILCEYKASVDETNVESKTALHLACESGFKEIIEILMAFGASVNMSDRDGKTPLELLSLRNIESQPVNNGGFTMGGLEALSKDLKATLLRREIYSDICFQFGEQTLPAHQNIIHARAPDFLEKMKTDEPKDEMNQSIIKPANTSYGAFKLLLEWIYTATIEIEEVDLDIAMELYTKSDLYNLPILKVFIEGVINSNLDITTAKALFEVALSSKATTIIETCANFIAKNYGKILKHSLTAIQDSNAMDVVTPHSQNNKNLFSTEALSEISSRLNIIEGALPVIKDDSVPVSQESFIKPVLPAKSEKNSLPASNNNKKNIPQQPSKPAPQNTNKSSQPINKPITKEEPPSDLISVKNIDLIKKLIQDLFESEYAIEFREPVSKDYTYYYDTILKPMDLGTIKKALQLGGRKKYKTIQEVAADVRLIFNNARTFNLNASPIYECAETLIQKFEDSYSVLKAKLNFPKSFDPPVKFIPPQINIPAPIENQPIASTPVSAQNRKKKISPEVGKQEDNTKKRKVERKNEIVPVPKQLARPALTEEASQLEVEILTSDLSKILHIQEVALEIIKIAYGDHGSDEEYELDISTLPSPAIRKLQQFVKDFKLKNPDHNFKSEDEKISEDD